MQLEIDVRTEDGSAIVTPRGEIDLATQGQLKKAIDDMVVAGDVNLVIDLDETTFLDSTGLGVLIGARRKAYAFKGSFCIVCSNEDLLRLFRMTSLDKVFTIHESRAAATTSTS
ncbi:MAG TPA: STAS domain-containing protein [Nocardioidaceae bacterium]|nr:STAS domain-containing protein [Nocardioidaceae bacterium]